MHTPVITIALASIAGILLGQGFLYFPVSITIVLCILVPAAGIIAWFEKFTLRRSLLIVLPGLIGMAAYLFSAAWFPPSHYTRLFTPDKAVHTIDGVIASPLDRDPDRTGFALDVHTIDGTSVSGKLRVGVREELASVGYGDSIRVSGKLYEPRGSVNPGSFDYPAYLAQSGISYTVAVKNAEKIEILRRGAGVFRTVQDWRERIRQAFLASLTGQGSAIVQAMVLGEEGGLSDDIRDKFMAAGVTHIISISGSHLGMAAILCFGLIRGLLFLLPERFYHRLTLSTDPKKIAAWLTLPLVIFYTLLAGGQVATVRSLIMITAGLFALILDRKNALMQSLAIAALLILAANPQAVFDISFQLSYLSVLVIGAVVNLWNELQIEAKTTLQKIRNTTVLLMVISLSTTLATGPLVAHYFNQISFVGLLSNIVVVPFAGMIVVPLGLLAGVVSLLTHHLPLANLTQSVADIFIAIVVFFADLPFAEIHPPSPSVFWLLVAALFLISLFEFVRTRLLFLFKPFENTSRLSWFALARTGVAGALLVFFFARPFMPKGRTEITFPDVGQGDCAFVELASGKRVLIDGGGTRDNRFDIGRHVLAPCLWNRGVHTLDLVVLSHPHPDHMNGLLYVLKTFQVREVWTSGRDLDLPGYADLLRVVREKGIPLRTVSADDPPIMLGEAELKIIHPAAAFTPRTKKAFDAENNGSLVLRIADNKKTFLFPGDIGAPAERYLMQHGCELACDLLKVPHHGSRSSSTEDFVRRSRPGIAVVTVGKDNVYHHPADEVLARYASVGSRIFRTDSDGAVTVRNSAGTLEVESWSALVLKKIDLNDRRAWGKREQGNWNRLRIRTWGT